VPVGASGGGAVVSSRALRPIPVLALKRPRGKPWALGGTTSPGGAERGQRVAEIGYDVVGGGAAVVRVGVGDGDGDRVDSVDPDGAGVESSSLGGGGAATVREGDGDNDDDALALSTHPRLTRFGLDGDVVEYGSQVAGGGFVSAVEPAGMDVVCGAVVGVVGAGVSGPVGAGPG
jgi:hypothetical protein